MTFMVVLPQLHSAVSNGMNDSSPLDFPFNQELSFCFSSDQTGNSVLLLSSRQSTTELPATVAICNTPTSCNL